MSNSGRLINYSLRPAKCVERKILCELLAKFKTDVPIHCYRYIGFGSFYFSDFVLFHNQLNIDKMISIEKSMNTDRFDFNKPYKCIDMIYGSASHAIGNLISFSEETKDVIWLDYDGVFNADILNDILIALGKVSSGSFVFVTFNISVPGDEDSKKLPYLKEHFEDYLAPKLQEKEITKKTIPELLFSIVNTAVQKIMMARNVKEKVDLVASRIFFVKYKDNAEMLTFGYYVDYQGKMDTSSLREWPWYTENGSPYSIDVPCFTKAEIREINRMLPGSTVEEIHNKFSYLAEKDIKRYIDVYKYYPNFLDSQYYV